MDPIALALAPSVTAPADLDGVRGLVGWTMGLYVVGLLVISAFAAQKVETTEDFVVAGRRLPLWLSVGTLLATWFGAGTLMAAADEIRAEGVEAAALDPVGAGACLILVGLFLARPLWSERLITLPELFERRWGRPASIMAATLMVPTYLGWLAAQFMALAAIVELFFGIPLPIGLVMVAALGVGYTLMGGMWAVTLTDAFQIALVVVGLLVVTVQVLAGLGGGSLLEGWTVLRQGIPAEDWQFVPSGSAADLAKWTGVLAAGSLGNVASQELMQRVFAARSAQTARTACVTAGGLYLVLGVAPILLGLSARLIPGLPSEQSTIPALAGLFLSPVLAVIFVTTMVSVILSTVDSALLAPASVLARDVYGALTDRADTVTTVRVAVGGVGAVSLVLAFVGEDAYSMLEAAYELGMVSLLVPLVLAVYRRDDPRAAAIVSMVVGTGTWMAHMLLQIEDFLGVPGVPMGLSCTALSLLGYLTGLWWGRAGTQGGTIEPS